MKTDSLVKELSTNNEMATGQKKIIISLISHFVFKKKWNQHLIIMILNIEGHSSWEWKH